MHCRAKNRGFNLHEKSQQHIKAMMLWREKIKQDIAGANIHLEMHSKVVSEQMIWLESVFHVIVFLTANGLPFRGHEEQTDFNNEISGGLFLNTYADLLFRIKPELANIAQRLPINAKYTSPTIQNEVINVLVQFIRETVASLVIDARTFCIMADGTSDKNGEEVFGVVLRYKANNYIKERTLSVGHLKDRTAKGL